MPAETAKTVSMCQRFVGVCQALDQARAQLASSMDATQVEALRRFIAEQELVMLQLADELSADLDVLADQLSPADTGMAISEDAYPWYRDPMTWVAVGAAVVVTSLLSDRRPA